MARRDTQTQTQTTADGPPRADPAPDAPPEGRPGEAPATVVPVQSTAAAAAAAVAEAEAAKDQRFAVGPFLRRHAVFLAVAAAGLVGRGLVVTTYRPALIYMGDSAFYAEQAWADLVPGGWRPSGYAMFLRLIDGHAHLTRLVVVQHVLTFAVAVALYVVVVRALPARRSHWLAALVATPALLSPWILDLGQFLLADSLFTSMVMAGVVLVAKPGRPSFAVAVGSGVLLGASVVVRTAGWGPLTVAAAVLAVAAWRNAPPPKGGGTAHPARLSSRLGVGVRVGVFGLAAVVPLLGYATWSAADGGRFAVSAHSGFFLYGRVAPFADCSVLSRPELTTLCDPRPVADRPQPDVYLWDDAAPLRQGNDDIPLGREELAGEFAAEVVRAQPWMMTRTTVTYLAGYFSPVQHENARTSRAATWELPDDYSNILTNDDPHYFDGYYLVTEMNSGLAGVLADYSKSSYAPMPAVGAGLLAGLAAAAVARVRRRPGPPRLFWVAGGAGMSVLMIGALTAGFDYRYLASVIGLLGAAAVTGFASLAGSVAGSVAGTGTGTGARGGNQ